MEKYRRLDEKKSKETRRKVERDYMRQLYKTRREEMKRNK